MALRLTLGSPHWADGRFDVRRVALRRTGGRFSVVRPFNRHATCGVLASATLGGPVFGGEPRRGLRIAYVVTRPAQVTVTVFRGKKVVLQRGRNQPPAEVTQHLTIPDRRLSRRGTYRVRIVVRSANGVEVMNLWARRL